MGGRSQDLGRDLTGVTILDSTRLIVHHLVVTSLSRDAQQDGGLDRRSNLSILRKRGEVQKRNWSTHRFVTVN